MLLSETWRDHFSSWWSMVCSWTLVSCALVALFSVYDLECICKDSCIDALSLWTYPVSSMFPKSTHETFSQKLYQTFSEHKRFIKPKLARTEFKIAHYAGEVHWLFTVKISIKYSSLDALSRKKLFWHLIRFYTSLINF